MKYEIMTFKLLQYHIVKYDTMANIDYIFYLHGNKHCEILVSCSDEDRNCMQAHVTACKLKAYVTACKLI